MAERETSSRTGLSVSTGGPAQIPGHGISLKDFPTLVSLSELLFERMRSGSCSDSALVAKGAFPLQSNKTQPESGWRNNLGASGSLPPPPNLFCREISERKCCRSRMKLFML